MKKLDNLKIISNPHRLNASSCVKDSVSIVEPIIINQHEIVKKVEEIKISQPEHLISTIEVF